MGQFLTVISKLFPQEKYGWSPFAGKIGQQTNVFWGETSLLIVKALRRVPLPADRSRDFDSLLMRGDNFVSKKHFQSYIKRRLGQDLIFKRLEYES